VIEATGALTTVDVGEATATDDNGIQLIVNNSPRMFPLGSSTVVWTVIDNAGNSAFATQQVNVVDTTPPSISLVSDIVAEAITPFNNIIELQSPEAHDIMGAISITNNAPEFFSIGETTVTWIATDESGNTVSTEHKVTVIDTISPILQIPEDIIVEATSSDQNEVQLGEPTATDNGEITSIINDAPEFFALGDITVIWTASDSSGNISTGNQLVTVTDTTAPEISQLEDIIAEATSVNENIVNLDEPLTSDIQELTIYKDAPGVFPIGDTLVTWIVTDDTGNHSIATQTVTIVDTTIPTLTLPEDLTVEAASFQETLVNIGQAEADDISGISSIGNNAPDVFPLGSTVVTWSTTDNHHNTISAEQTITVVDTTVPTIITPQNIVREAVNPTLNFIQLGELVASDSVGIESISNDKPITFQFGSTTVTWTVTDTSGNTSQATQVVTIIDTTAPDVSAPSDIVAEATDLSNNVIELGDATAYDIMNVASITNDAPEFFPVGETIVTWTVTDLSGNSSTATQTVTIIDTITPSITTPDSITAEATSADSNTVELGIAIYNDLVDISSITNDAPEFFPVGKTIVTWTVTDSSGNSSTATQTVTIIDTTVPVLTVPEDVTITAFSLEKEVDVGTALAIDLVDSMPTVTNNAPETFPLGDTLVTWSVSDEFGNSASYEQVISVQPCGESLSYYNQILGTFEDDIITGTQFADLIFAFGGNDIIFGGQGNDCIIGGGGDDFIFGNAGSDHLVGGEGNDILKGNSGEDKLTGGLGFDILDGGDDFDVSYDSVSDIIIACEEEL
jgi:Ca2+-binding RTX toxin-like protein